MKKHLFTIINAVGCLLLLGVVLLQWSQNELQRQAFRDVQEELRSTEETRAEALDRAASLSNDIADLKTALTAAQKAAEESALAQKAQRDQLATLTAQRDAQNKELTDQVSAQVIEWQEAIKKRDATIKEQNALLEAQSRKLNEAITKLKQAGAR